MPPAPLQRIRVVDFVLVLGFGAALLAVSLRADPPKLAWSDELIYALVGRHIADGHGNVSSITHPMTLAARAYPHPDVHLPGHMYCIALGFKLLGVREGVALAPSLAGFLASGALLHVAGARHFGRAAGLLAGSLFYLFPPNLAYANSAMAESTLQALSAAYLALWLEATARPRHSALGGLGLLLGLGAFHRETFLVFLPSALWALRAWPSGARLRAALWLAAPLTLILALLVWPAYLAKAPYPHALSELAGRGLSTGLLEALLQNALANLRQLPFFGPLAWQHCALLQIGLLLGAALLWRRGPGQARVLAGYSLFASLGTWVPLLPLYRMPDWIGVRLLMAASVPLILAGAVWLCGLRRPVARIAIGTSLVVCALATTYATVAQQQDRSKWHEEGRRLADYLLRTTAGWRPRLVMAPKAYRYAWDAYPVVVIPWDTTMPAMQELAAAHGPVDLYLIRGGRELQRFRRAMLRGAFGAPYRSAGEPLDDFYFPFVREGAS